MASVAHRAAAARAYWLRAARAEQVPVDAEWRLLWLVMSGRGFGKTREGAEETVWGAVRAPGSRWACVAPTGDDARETMALGPSGLEHVLDRYSSYLGFPCYTHEKHRTSFSLWNGSRIRYLGAERPDRLRGPNWHGGWADEVAAWRYPDTWDQLELSVRARHRDLPAARIIATTTPKPTPLVRRIHKQADHVVVGSTYDNEANLDPAFIAKLEGLYGGTRFGRQELHGVLLDDIEGAMFKGEWLRWVSWPQPVDRVVVAIDPAGSHRPESNQTGIVVVGKHGDRFIVMADASGRYTPEQWGSLAWDTADRWGADAIVAERNYGGDMVAATLRQTQPRGGLHARPKTVTASRGKAVRAEPVAALYEQGRIDHVEGLTDLEQQMVEWVPGVSESPDRVDALVWAVTELAGRTVRPVQVFGT